ncbi:MAG TPA: hypothetical protein VN964_05265 [Gemmatimonadales bacterium]|nr:hypothetical protein [Gemmatimonadales bacterium]
MHRTVALTLALAACTRGPTDAAARPGQPAAGPVQLANPTATFNQLQAISAVTSTPLFESFTVLAPRFAPAGNAMTRSLALATLSLELAARYSPWHPKVPPLRMAERGTGGEDPKGAGIKGVRTNLPTGDGIKGVTTAALGTTFVWDPATNSYVASSDSGAPANGERFMLYALSQRTGLPSVPLTSIGYVDLTDSSAGATGVTLVGTPAAEPPATYASYSVAAGGASLAGFVTDGTTRLDLNVRADSTTPPGTLREQTAIAVAGQDLHVDESVTVSGENGDTVRMTTDLRVASGGEVVRAAGDVTLDTTTHLGSGQMAVSVNDSAFATITLGGPDLAFVPAPDVTLTTADETTLRALFSTSFELFGTTRLLLVPATSSPPVSLRAPFVPQSSASGSFARAV